MHLVMILAALGISWCLRCYWSKSPGSYLDRWRQAVCMFLIPPLLLLATVGAIVWMGPWGEMVRPFEGWLSYGLSWSFLGLAGALLLYLICISWCSVRQVQQYPQQTVAGRTTRFLDTPAVISAQVGFWQPELIVSQGLLSLLDREHLNAVLVHEQGHLHYRDTFWFFWLGWLRRLTCWLPNTEALWQELLLLREMRADQWAAQRVDALLLAEALLAVVQTPFNQLQPSWVAFGGDTLGSRLEERINALLGEAIVLPTSHWWQGWHWIALVLLPLAVVPFHA